MTDLLLVDGKHALWRAADVHQELSVEAADGSKMDTGAIYGFLKILCRVHEEYNPIMTVICWDDWQSGPAVRRAMFAGYKDKGDFDSLPVPQQMLIKSMGKQQPVLMGLMDLMGIRQAYSPGWEADDVLGTLAARYSPANTVILTGDRDLLQCVSDHVTVVRPGTGDNKGQFIPETPEKVAMEWGVGPERFVELKALAGDSGDRIPGARGIGKKMAAKILDVFPTAEEAVKAAEAGPEAWPKPLTESMRGKVKASADDVRLSHRLAKINIEAPLKFRARARNQQRVQDLLIKMKFKTIFLDGRFQRLMGMSD